MALVTLDAIGLRCPQPVLKIAMKVPELGSGDVLEVRADCPTFEQDLRKWCTRMNRALLAVNTEGSVKVARIQF